MPRFTIHVQITEEGILANGEWIDHSMYSDDMRGPSFPGMKKTFRRDLVRRSLKQMGLHLPRGASLGTEWTEPVESVLIGWEDFDFAEEVDTFDTSRHNRWTIDIDGTDVPVEPGSMIESRSATIGSNNMLRHRRRRTASGLPARIRVGTVLDGIHGPLTVTDVSYSTMTGKVWLTIEGEDEVGEGFEEENLMDFILDNYLR